MIFPSKKHGPNFIYMDLKTFYKGKRFFNINPGNVLLHKFANYSHQIVLCIAKIHILSNFYLVQSKVKNKEK